LAYRTIIDSPVATRTLSNGNAEFAGVNNAGVVRSAL